MDAIFIFNLIQPCKNRNISFANNKDGFVTIAGIRCETMQEADKVILSFPRKDFALKTI